MQDHANALMRSFIPHTQDSLFSLHNLPYGIFYDENNIQPRAGTAIGEFVLDLNLIEEKGLLLTEKTHFFNQRTLNQFAAAGSAVWSAVRKRLQYLLSDGNNELQSQSALLEQVCIPVSKVRMLPPFHIGGFTDFYASQQHAENVGRLFRGNENALLPNWKYLPVAYNGRASTVYLSETPILRPHGQIMLPQQEAPQFGPTQKLDFELEIGAFIGKGNEDGKPIALHQAKNSIFGCVLLNDWSARDIQAFEYQPLGPFLAKSFATSISPWVVPYAALEPFMQDLPAQEPQPVSYLYQTSRKQLNIQLQVQLQPTNSSIKTTICQTNSMNLYWTLEQMIAHHTVNNCRLLAGDLLGTGTISGPKKENWGSLLELTYNGKEPLHLNDGSIRTFLEDGDSVIMSAYCDAGDYKIGFGEVKGTIISI